MAALGFDPEDYDEEDSIIEVWECNADAFYVFEAMATQWRSVVVGMGSAVMATGFDYAAMPVVMDMVGIERKRRPEVFSSVRIMETEALATMAENRDNG